MFTKNTKRYVACMMLFFMLFTLVPVQAFAETDSHEGMCIPKQSLHQIL